MHDQEEEITGEIGVKPQYFETEEDFIEELDQTLFSMRVALIEEYREWKARKLN